MFSMKFQSTKSLTKTLLSWMTLFAVANLTGKGSATSTNQLLCSSVKTSPQTLHTAMLPLVFASYATTTFKMASIGATTQKSTQIYLIWMSKLRRTANWGAVIGLELLMDLIAFTTIMASKQEHSTIWTWLWAITLSRSASCLELNLKTLG